MTEATEDNRKQRKKGFNLVVKVDGIDGSAKRNDKVIAVGSEGHGFRSDDAWSFAKADLQLLGTVGGPRRVLVFLVVHPCNDHFSLDPQIQIPT